MNGNKRFIAQYSSLITQYSSLSTHHSVLITPSLIQLRLQPPERGRRLGKVRLLFERQTVMLHRLERPVAHLVDAAEIEVRKGVGFVTRGQQRSLEPAHTTIRITLGQKVTANV